MKINLNSDNFNWTELLSGGLDLMKEGREGKIFGEIKNRDMDILVFSYAFIF